MPLLLKFSQQFSHPNTFLAAVTHVPAVSLPLDRFFSRQLTAPNQVLWCSELEESIDMILDANLLCYTSRLLYFNIFNVFVFVANNIDEHRKLI